MNQLYMRIILTYTIYKGSGTPTRGVLSEYWRLLMPGFIEYEPIYTDVPPILCILRVRSYIYMTAYKPCTRLQRVDGMASIAARSHIHL